VKGNNQEVSIESKIVVEKTVESKVELSVIIQAKKDFNGVIIAAGGKWES